jgi:TetR/AcrR family transcriptional regulator, cholesterol catabolism regulator
MNEELNNILTKVRCLYWKYGIKSVTMDDVSRELGISKKTLYQYVKDKNELVEKVVDMEIERYGIKMEEIFSKNLCAIDELLEVNLLLSKMIKEHNPSQEYDLKKYYPDQYDKMLKIRRERIFDNTLRNIRKGKAEGLYRADLKEEIIAKVQLLRVERVLDTEIFSIEDLSSEKVFIEIFIYHIRGVASQKGIEVLEKKLKELESNNI